MTLIIPRTKLTLSCEILRSLRTSLMAYDKISRILFLEHIKEIDDLVVCAARMRILRSVNIRRHIQLCDKEHIVRNLTEEW